jgi:hypothetical protein
MRPFTKTIVQMEWVHFVDGIELSPPLPLGSGVNRLLVRDEIHKG